MCSSALQTAPAIDMQDVSFALTNAVGTTSILQGINLKIHKNDTVAITGPSGSGKTSLLMLIAGLEAPTAGQIHVCGNHLAEKNEDELARLRAQHIGIVFQSFHLIPTMTALENVALPLEFLERPEAKKHAEEVLASLGLGHRLHHYPSQLSGGEQQRVAIARACVTRPTILMADEPTGNLDHETGEQVINLLLSIQKTYGSTLLLITHDPVLAKRCNHILHIVDGRIT